MKRVTLAIGTGTRRPHLMAVVVMATLAIGAAGAVPASAVTPTLTPMPPSTTTVVNNGPGNQVDPHVSGNLVAYTDFAKGQIRYHDLATGVDAAIPLVSAGFDALPDVSGTTIFYTHVGDGTRSIYSYDVASGGPPTELDPHPASNRRSASIGGPTVAWVDFGYDPVNGTSEIVVYDRATDTATRLTSDTAFDRDPAVSPSGTVIAWSKCTGAASGCDIWQATLAGGAWTTRQLTSTADDEFLPDTNGSVVVYGSFRDGENDIYWQPVGGGPEGHLALPGDDRNANLSGSVVTFEHFQADAPSPSTEIYAYDLATNALYRLTDTRENESLADVWEGPDGTVNVVWTRRDVSGDDNVYASTFHLGHDTTPPLISVTSPVTGGTYLLRQSVGAAYSCADEPGGSGVGSCVGPVPSGSPIDTASAGTKTFTVNAFDNVGNAASTTVTYGVTYGICPLFDQSRSYKLGSTVPVKLRLCDANGSTVSGGIPVTAVGLTKVGSTASALDATDAGNANPDNQFRYDANLGGYIYNLSTKSLTSGTWALSFTVAGDTVVHKVQFDLR